MDDKPITLYWPSTNHHVIEDQPKANFVFVNLAGSRTIDGHSQRAIRSHVRRKAWNLKKSGHHKPRPRTAIADHTQSTGTIPHDLSGTEDKYDYSIMTLVGDGCNTLPTQGQIGRAGLDPFRVFPIKLTPRVRYLIGYGVESAVRTSVHEDINNTFSRYVGGNTGLLYVTLAWASARVSGGRMATNTESVFYINNSVSAVRQELQTWTQSQLADGTIAAVACIANMENLSGDNTIAQIHMDGLKQMVCTRGGPDSLPIVLRRLVMWADLLNATKQLSLPTFRMRDSSNLEPLSAIFPLYAMCPIQTVNNGLLWAAAQTEGTSLSSILRDCHELAYLIDITPRDNTLHSNMVSYPDRVYSLEYDVLELLSSVKTHPRQQMPSNTAELCIIPLLLHALLLFVYTNLRLTPVGDQTRMILTTRLHYQMKQSDMSSLIRLFHSELIWILFLGAVSAEERSEAKSWFKNRLLWAVMHRYEYCLEWEIILEALRGFVLFEDGFMKSCEDLWRAILSIG